MVVNGRPREQSFLPRKYGKIQHTSSGLAISATWKFGISCTEDAYSFSSTMGCLTWNSAFCLLSEMQRLGPTFSLHSTAQLQATQLPPLRMERVGINLVSSNAAISACERRAAWREALLLLSHGLRDTTTCNTIISACGSSLAKIV